MFAQPPEHYRSLAPTFRDARELVSIGLDHHGREAFLHPLAARAWLRMTVEARHEGIALVLISAFRSIERQRQLVQRKLDQGQTWDDILRVNAYPGFSEHHTGCAVDIASPKCPHLVTEFELTNEFIWLAARGKDFDFYLSYPRGNASGVQFEPWHWLWRGKLEPATASAT
jgi:zinc D-Ala-D-Ala carboxypeptidase